MNYQKIYDNLMQKAKNEKRNKSSKTNINYIYYENHHIIPRCIGGLDTIENLVLLTAREHYMAHKILMFMHPKTMGIIYAFKYMSQLYKNARDYSYAKELYNALPASEKTKEKKLQVWYDLNLSSTAVYEYLESIKHVSYSPDYDRTIHIKFKKL